MASVDIRDVRKSFGSVEVVRGVSIDIADGEFVVLVGPSGCGKSTLLRMIAGLEDDYRGRNPHRRRVVNDVPPKERDIAMVFQNYALYPHMTVAREHELRAAAASRRRKPRSRARSSRAAGMLGLKQLLARFPRQLSGGQRQRVAIGRAIVRDPRCSCSTSRCPISTPSCACRCAPRSRSCISAWRRRRSTSRTTRSRR